MLYEKKSKITPKISKTSIALVTFTTTLLFELSYLYFPSEFWGPIKLIDVINAIAQFATAGAFYLGFHQYKKNKESERQVALASECKTLITQMQEIIDQTKTGEETDITNLSTNITKLENLASSFNAIFEVLSEDINKAIVRMHWQGMYFNNFTHTFNKIDLGRILFFCGVSPTRYTTVLKQAQKELDADPPILFYEYSLMKKVVEAEWIKEKFTPKGKIELPILFPLYFFDNKSLNDHLYGCMNIIDIRAKAPALAVLFEQLKSPKALKDTNRG